MKLNKRQQSDLRPRTRPIEATGQQRKVYSYYAGGSSSPDRSEERRSHSRKWSLYSLRLLPAVIAVVVIIGSVLYSFTLGTMPSTTTLQNQPSPYRDLSEYAQTADEILRRDLRSRTKLTIQTHEVEQTLLDTYPELNDAVLRLPVLGRKPTLVLEIRRPVLLLSADSKVYVLDKNGIAVSEASQITPSSKEGLPTIQDQSDVDVTVGKQVLTRETLQFISDSIYHLSAKGFTIDSIGLPTSINELDIQLKGLPFYIKTDTSGEARLQIGSFIAVHEHLQEQGTTPREYIDVRIEEKTFYK